MPIGQKGCKWPNGVIIKILNRNPILNGKIFRIFSEKKKERKYHPAIIHELIHSFFFFTK